MRILPLSGKIGAGRFALVDDDDLNRLATDRWLYRDSGKHDLQRVGGRSTVSVRTSNGTRLPRAILTHHGVDLTNAIILYRNGWPFDNRKENLILGRRNDNRRTGRRQNIHCNGKEWQVIIGQTNYGLFPTKEAAQVARDKIAHELGYATAAEQSKHLAAITEALDGYVHDGLLIIHPDATRLEDRYRLPCVKI